MSLKDYQSKRKFTKTPEPRGESRKKTAGKPLTFVVQMHDASRLHYDFRLEFDGTLKSWAVPKGPSLNPLDQRLAVHVEDHPLEYGDFEGVIPSGNYGAGTVMVWDRGTFVERSSKGRADSEKALLAGMAKGHITFILDGEKLKGEFALVKLKKGGKDEKAWLLLKKRDKAAKYKGPALPMISAKTGRTLDEITSQAKKKGEIWLSNRQYESAPDGEKPKARKGRSIPPPEKASKKVKTELLPRKLKPMIAAAGLASDDLDGWWIEPFGAGKRALAYVDLGAVNLVSRSGLNFDRKFPELRVALQKIKHHLLLDGEVVGEKPGVFRALDVLHIDGQNLRGLPLRERWKRLSKLGIFGKEVELVPHFEPTRTPKSLSPPFLARHPDSPYTSGTSRYWRKLLEEAVEEAPAPPKKASERAPAPKRTPKKRPETRVIEGGGPVLTHLNKIFFPREGYTKGDILDYYQSIASTILPHLHDRAESMNRHPHGITDKGFYQKDVTGYVPKWVKTKRIYSEHRDGTINYLLCQNEWTLLYMVNLGCIEINPWISRVQSPDNPDYVVIDLDPDDKNTFEQVMEVAHHVREILEAIDAEAYIKTSGATGLHINIPIQARYDFDQSRDFAHKVCERVHAELPRITSLERNPMKRRGKIYLDYMQNRRGSTMAAPYCVRPRPLATVSTPLRWKELTGDLSPEMFTIETLLPRLKQVGDLWAPMLSSKVDLAKCLKKLQSLRAT